ncbi:hypothetical protein GBA52_025063 [Prunus armeniaca]|nr:hypothetical protein GBA52_025063 [Prunus armeniaca]
MHKNLKDGIGIGMKLVKCIPRIERSLLRLRNENVKDDFDSNNSHPLLRTHLQSLKEHAASIFTHDIYKLIRNEINKEAKLILMQPVRNNEDPLTTVAYKRLKAEFGKLNTLVETWKKQHEQTSLNLGCHHNVVRDPIVAMTTRMQTTGSKGKKAPQCGECKVTGHNKRNCPNHIVGESVKRKRGYTSDRSDILSSFGPEDDTTVGNKTFYSSSSAVHGTKTLSSSCTTPNSGFSYGEVSSSSTRYTSDGFTFETPEYSVLDSQFDTQASPPRNHNRFWVPFTPIK